MQCSFLFLFTLEHSICALRAPYFLFLISWNVSWWYKYHHETFNLSLSLLLSPLSLSLSLTLSLSFLTLLSLTVSHSHSLIQYSLTFSHIFSQSFTHILWHLLILSHSYSLTHSFSLPFFLPLSFSLVESYEDYTISLYNLLTLSNTSSFFSIICLINRKLKKLQEKVKHMMTMNITYIARALRSASWKKADNILRRLQYIRVSIFRSF